MGLLAFCSELSNSIFFKDNACCLSEYQSNNALHARLWRQLCGVLLALFQAGTTKETFVWLAENKFVPMLPKVTRQPQTAIKMAATIWRWEWKSDPFYSEFIHVTTSDVTVQDRRIVCDFVLDTTEDLQTSGTGTTSIQEYCSVLLAKTGLEEIEKGRSNKNLRGRTGPTKTHGLSVCHTPQHFFHTLTRPNVRFTRLRQSGLLCCQTLFFRSFLNTYNLFKKKWILPVSMPDSCFVTIWIKCARQFPCITREAVPFLLGGNCPHPPPPFGFIFLFYRNEVYKQKNSIKIVRNLFQNAVNGHLKPFFFYPWQCCKFLLSFLNIKNSRQKFGKCVTSLTLTHSTWKFQMAADFAIRVRGLN